MQTRNIKLNKLVLGSLIATSAVVLSASSLALQPKLRVYADASPSSVVIENSSFELGAGVPTGWNSITSLNSSVIAKIVNTDSDKFEENKQDYNLTINPGKVTSSSDNKVFMINSTNIAVSYGYQSNSFTLASNGYYVINVPVRTQDAAWASLYLVDESNNFKLKCENITATDSYKTYTFYVATNSVSLDVNLQLYLGSESNTSKGAVFFDEISAYSYSESTFYTLYEARNQNSVSHIPSYMTYAWNTADNSELTKLSEDGYNASAEGFVQKIYSLETGTEYPDDVVNPSNANLIDNNYALLLQNKSSASVGVRYNSAIEFGTYDYVLYSAYVKTNTVSGGVTLKLVEKDDDGNFNQVGAAISNFITNENDKLNGWEKVTFAIKTSAFESKQLYTEFWLGNESTQAEGSAFIGKRVITSITSDEYDKLTTSSSLVKVNFDNLTEDSSCFANHSFNNFEKTGDYTSNKTFIKPANLNKLDNLVNNYGSWKSTDNFASGIINTNATVFNSYAYPFANPGLTPSQSHSDLTTQTNNVLAIYQNSTANQGYNTETVNLSAKSYYKVSVYVKTSVYSTLSQGIDNVYGGARWALIYKDVAIAEFKNIVSNSEWTTLSAYIQTGLDDMEISAELCLGNEELKCSGVAFFDDMMVETATEAEFNSATANNFTQIINFKNDTFNLTSAEKNGYGLYSSKNWTTSQTDVNSISGILNTNDISSTVIENNFPGMPVPTTETGSSNVLFINNKADLATTYTNTFTQTLNSGSYYKISVWAKVHSISQSESSVKYEDKEETIAIPYGAYISIDRVEDSFKAITSTDWKQYIFYVNADKDIDLKLNLGLGYENAYTSGYAYFSDVVVENMDEESYTSATSAYTEDSTPDNIILVKTTLADNNDNEETNTNQNGGGFDPILISTLITSLALIIAIIGTILRQVNFKRFVKLKKKSNNYDRRKTQTKMKSVRRAEIENIVKEKVDELTAKLNNLESIKQEQEQKLNVVKQEYLSYKNKKLNKQQAKAKRIAKHNYLNVYNAYNNTCVDINILKDDIAKIKSERYILKEEYALMLQEWREEKQAKRLEKKNQKAKQKLK